MAMKSIGLKDEVDEILCDVIVLYWVVVKREGRYCKQHKDDRVTSSSDFE